MKPFNLEAAKRGEPITDKDGRELRFIGISTDDYIVAESVKPGRLHYYTHCLLFMAPKKRTVWVNLYSLRHGEAVYFSSQASADAADACRTRKRSGGKAYPVELEE